MKGRSRALALLGGGVFCAAALSLYRMLQLLQATPPSPHTGQWEDWPRLQQKIDSLERRLSDSNQLIAAVRDALLHRKASWKERGGGGANESSTHGAAETMQGCRLAEKNNDGPEGVQLLDVYDLLTFDNPDGGAWKQGFEIGYRGDEWAELPLEVFIVPHSHNDPGWLKTFDDYYRDQTRHILDNMVLKLTEDSRRKMIWAEISYFSKWWDDIDEQKREMVKRLVQSGQLEMVTGGWVMADEANSHYFSLLDQLMEGHQWLQRHLGVRPHSGWAVDPFGHSPSMAYLLKGAGLGAMLIQRVHYAVKKHFAQKQTLEFLWRQNWDSSPRSDIMCHMMPFYSYDVPHTCGPNPAVCCQFDFHRLPGGRVSCPWRLPPQPITEQNIQERALLLLDQYRQKSRLFRSSILLVPLGDDFRFVESSEWDAQFQNYQKIFDFYNSHPELRVKARFGTLSDYFLSLQRRLDAEGEELPVLRGDFFTYADRDDHYWSGYFTSRPFYKRLDRVMEATLRASEILYSLALAEIRHFRGDASGFFPAADGFRQLVAARRNLALFQHHDAVTGTSRDRVVQDYGTRLFHSLLSLRQVLQSSAHWLLLLDKSQFHHDEATPLLQMDDVQPVHDALPRKTVMKIGAKPRSLIIFNPTEQLQSSVVSIFIDSPDARVVDVETNQPILSQISAVWEEPTRSSTENFQLSFIASLPPLSLVIYHVTRASSGSAPRAEYTFLHSDSSVSADHFRVLRPSGAEADAPLSLKNKHVQIWSSPRSGFLQKLRLLSSGLQRQIQIHFLWYGTRTEANRDKSGAYLFLPDGPAQPYSQAEPPLVRVTRGQVFSDITSCYRHFTHTLRLYHVDGHAGSTVELSNMVDIRSEVNRELVMRLVSDIANGNRFYSDLNGFQMQQRRIVGNLPLQALFFPCSSSSFLQDSESRLTLLTAQSQAAAALQPGHLEVVLDRRLNQDDNRGLGQGVTDNKLTASFYRLLLEDRRGRGGLAEEVGGASVAHLSLLAHLSSLALCHPPIILHGPAPSPPSGPAPPLPKLRPFQPLRASFPCDLHLLNLRSMEGEEAGSPSQEAALLLHRKGFDCSTAPPIPLTCTRSAHEDFNLDEVFASLHFIVVHPTSLTLLDDKSESARQQPQRHIISLRPMEISAFRVEIG
ncbi:alpha-mannosidase 2 isoform X2 [Centroberyx gerrardi]